MQNESGLIIRSIFYEGIFKSWSNVLSALCGDGVFDIAIYETLEQTKFCRIIRAKELAYAGWKHIYFVVDIKSCTVEQAIATTKIGCIILTHNS